MISHKRFSGHVVWMATLLLIVAASTENRAESQSLPNRPVAVPPNNVAGVQGEAAPARGDGQPSPGTEPEPARPSKVLLLPTLAKPGVRNRYADRLDAAMQTARRSRPPDGATETIELPREVVRNCDQDLACLTQAGRSMGATRAVRATLDRDGDDFLVTTSMHDLKTGAVVASQPKSVSHYRLRSQGAAMFDEVMRQADRPRKRASPAREGNAADSPYDQPTEPVDSAPEPDEFEGSQATQPSTGEGNPAGVDQPEEATAERDPAVGADGLPIEGTQTGDAYADKREKTGGKASILDGPQRKKRQSWTASFEERRELFTRRAQKDQGGRERLILMAWFLGLGVVSFGIGFGAAQLLPAVGRVARQGFRFSSGMGAKEEALTYALLRQCCKQVTPGVIMSTEFESLRHFTFAILDGHSLAIDVSDYQEGDKLAFRKGASLCAQFVHQDRACVCMLEVQAARKHGKRLRVVLGVAGRLADIELPQTFHVPVDGDSPLRAQLSFSRDGKEFRWLSRVAQIGALGLCAALDDEAPKLEEGQVLDASVRLLELRADVRAKVTAVQDSVVALQILPEEGEHDPPAAYQAVAKQASAAWVAA